VTALDAIGGTPVVRLGRLPGEGSADFDQVLAVPEAKAFAMTR
jgi:hypothetical protein